MLDENRNVKLIDFGFSTCIPNEQKIKIFCGTPSYMAPEIIKKTEFCGPPCDIYASGVLMFAFFCGQFPFRGQNDKDLYIKIEQGNLVIPDYVPSGPRSLISRCMQLNPDDRPTSAQIWADPWMHIGYSTQVPNDVSLMGSTGTFSHRGAGS
jgi:serine/threonine protein kinase